MVQSPIQKPYKHSKIIAKSFHKSNKIRFYHHLKFATSSRGRSLANSSKRKKNHREFALGFYYNGFDSQSPDPFVTEINGISDFSGFSISSWVGRIDRNFSKTSNRFPPNDSDRYSEKMYKSVYWYPILLFGFRDTLTVPVTPRSSLGIRVSSLLSIISTS